MRFNKRLMPRDSLDGVRYAYAEDFSLVNGGGSGGGTSSTNTVQKSDPWGPAQGYLQNIMQQAQQNYFDGKDNLYPDISPIAGISDQTQQGLDTRASGNVIDNLSAEAAQAGVTTLRDSQRSNVYDMFQPAAANAATFNEEQIANAGNAQQNAQEGVNAGIATAQSNVPNYLRGVAEGTDATGAINGILNGVDDPALRAYTEASNKQIADNLMRNNLMPAQVQALAGGSYGGSGTQATRRGTANDIADTIGRNTNKLALDQQGKQLQAAQLANSADSGASQIDLNTLMAGLQTAQTTEGFQQTDIGNAFAAGEQALGATEYGDTLALDSAKTSAFALPVLGEVPFQQANRQIEVGSFYDQRAQAERDAEIATQLYNQDAPNRELQNYANIALPAAGYGGTTSTTSTAPAPRGPSRAQGAAGGATAGASFGPWGAVIGGVLGAVLT